VKTGLVDSDADRLLVAARVAGYRTPRVFSRRWAGAAEGGPQYVAPIPAADW